MQARKGWLFTLAFLIGIGAAVAFNQYRMSVFNDVQVDDLVLNTDNLRGSDLVARVTTSASTPNVAFTGVVNSSTMTISGSQGLRFQTATITAASTVPAAAGILALDSAYVLYVSTGTGAGAWVKIGGQ